MFYLTYYSIICFRTKEQEVIIENEDLEKSAWDCDKINQEENIRENYNPIPKDFEIESGDKNHEDKSLKMSGFCILWLTPMIMVFQGTGAKIYAKLPGVPYQKLSQQLKWFVKDTVSYIRILKNAVKFCKTNGGEFLR